MATCSRCGEVELPGRRRVCDDCKARRAVPVDEVHDDGPADRIDYPHGLHAGGRALWASLGATAGTPDGVLALEACRLVDRLDELDRIIAGKGVLNLMRFRVPDVFTGPRTRKVIVEVKFASVLGEARQQQTVLKNIMTALGGAGAPARPAPPAAVDPATPAAKTKPPTPLEQMRQRRREQGR